MEEIPRIPQHQVFSVHQEAPSAREFTLELQDKLGAATVATLWWNSSTRAFIDLERNPARRLVNLDLSCSTIIRDASGEAIVMVLLKDYPSLEQRAVLDSRHVIDAAKHVAQHYPELNDTPIFPGEFHDLKNALSVVLFQSHDVQKLHNPDFSDLELLKRVISAASDRLDAYKEHGRMPESFMPLSQRIAQLSRESLMRTDFDIEDDLAIPNWVADEVYQVVLEALLNARRHTRARSFSVRLRPIGDEAVRVEIADDGFGGASFKLGGGLSTIRQHVVDAGGRIELESSDVGTQIVVTLPCA